MLRHHGGRDGEWSDATSVGLPTVPPFCDPTMGNPGRRCVGRSGPGCGNQCRSGNLSLVVDAHFAVPRLVEIYDALDPDRHDLDVYVAIVSELGASAVLDIGCGTGTFACLLSRMGKDVTGLDPASASLDVARRKPGSDRVQWIEGDPSALPALQVDLVVMTGNVPQVFLTDHDWLATLQAAHAALRASGWLVFETRAPAAEAWRDWSRTTTYRCVDIPGLGYVETWVDVTKEHLPFVSFRTTFVFASDGVVLTSDSTLRFRSLAEITHSLESSGFTVVEARDAPDRPGREMVFIAARAEIDNDQLLQR